MSVYLTGLNAGMQKCCLELLAMLVSITLGEAFTSNHLSFPSTLIAQITKQRYKNVLS